MLDASMQLFGSKRKTTEDKVKGVYMYGSVGRLVYKINSGRVVQHHSLKANMFDVVFSFFDHGTKVLLSEFDLMTCLNL